MKEPLSNYGQRHKNNIFAKCLFVTAGVLFALGMTGFLTVTIIGMSSTYIAISIAIVAIAGMLGLIGVYKKTPSATFYQQVLIIRRKQAISNLLVDIYC